MSEEGERPGFRIKAQGILITVSVLNLVALIGFGIYIGRILERFDSHAMALADLRAAVSASVSREDFKELKALVNEIAKAQATFAITEATATMDRGEIHKQIGELNGRVRDLERKP